MNPSPFCTYEEIVRALPEGVSVTKERIIRLGQRSGSQLRFIRPGGKCSDPVWRRSQVIRWFNLRFQHDNILCEHFARKLQQGFN
jgi:hypothetical protein